jgi:Mrp family chromosome partitioning ATPase
VKPSVTKRTELHHVIDQMRQVNARLLGVVLNDVDVGRARYRYYRRYYTSYKYKYYKGYYHSEAGSTKEKPSAHSSLMKGKSTSATKPEIEKIPLPTKLMKSKQSPQDEAGKNDSPLPPDSNSLL